MLLGTKSSLIRDWNTGSPLPIHQRWDESEGRSGTGAQRERTQEPEGHGQGKNNVKHVS